jgi:PAS domain S-box-containing protein
MPEGGTAPEGELLGVPFAANPHPMWVVDRVTHAFLDVNNAAVQHYGYSRQEFLKLTTLEIRPTVDIPELLRQTLNPRPQGPSTAEKWRHQTKNGTVFPVTITSWELTFHGRHAELVLARRDSNDLTSGGSALARSMQTQHMEEVPSLSFVRASRDYYDSGGRSRY